MDRRGLGPAVQHVPRHLRPRLPPGPWPGTHAVPYRLADDPRPRPAARPGSAHGPDRRPDRLLNRLCFRDGIPPAPRRAPTPLAAARTGCRGGWLRRRRDHSLTATRSQSQRSAFSSEAALFRRTAVFRALLRTGPQGLDPRRCRSQVETTNARPSRPAPRRAVPGPRWALHRTRRVFSRTRSRPGLIEVGREAPRPAVAVQRPRWWLLLRHDGRMA